MPESPWQSASGKVILTGEHAVVYGKPAIAGAFPDAMQARIKEASEGISIAIPQWHYRAHSSAKEPKDVNSSAFKLLNLIVERLALNGRYFDLELRGNVHPGMGLGASASLAVATIRSLDYYYRLGLSNSEVNALAFECETLSHGRPSGVDNYMACYGGLVLYQRKDSGAITTPIKVLKPLNVLVVMTPEKGSTANMLAKVASDRQQDSQKYNDIFDEIGGLSRQVKNALEQADMSSLGQLMTRNHGLLADLGVSTPILDNVVSELLDAGALGAKLTGSGGGGAVIALCDDNSHVLAKKMAQHGNDIMEVQLGV